MGCNTSAISHRCTLMNPSLNCEQMIIWRLDPAVTGERPSLYPSWRLLLPKCYPITQAQAWVNQSLTKTTVHREASVRKANSLSETTGDKADSHCACSGTEAPGSCTSDFPYALSHSSLGPMSWTDELAPGCILCLWLACLSVRHSYIKSVKVAGPALMVGGRDPGLNKKERAS